MLDLFSGIGGFSLAGKWANFETIAFCEKDKFCRQVLIKHWPEVPIHEDIKCFSYNQNADLLTAGFPCQPFSVAGKRKGKDDDRYLWPELCRIIKESKPRWLLLENVPGIISHLDPILQDLETEGYTWWSYIIAASSVGAPHKRERLWIIANFNSERCDKRGGYRQERHIQDDWQRHIAKIQSEWPQFIPKPWASMQANEWMSANSEFSRNDHGLSDRVDRIKALGNSIVPQVVYPFMALINLIEMDFQDGR